MLRYSLKTPHRGISNEFPKHMFLWRKKYYSDTISNGHNVHMQKRKVKISLHISLRKHAYSNILKISPPKTESFQIKNSDIFYISIQNIDCGYSLEPRWF